MEQVKPFKASRAGTKPYWCLQNVRLGYGLGPKHAYALLDWQKNLKQHKNQKFPAGVAVPVYWNWTGTVEGHTRNWGHIGVRLPDGRIWTDGKYFKSVAEVSSKYLSGGAYLGWGESVEGVRVVKEKAMAYKDIDKGYAKYKEDIKRIFGNIPAYFNYKNGWPKYQSWDRWKLNNQIARTQRRGRVNAEATIEVLKADLAKANKALTSLSTRPTKDELERVRAEAEKRVQQALSACEAHESEREVVENVLKRAWNKVIKWFFSKE